MSMIDNVEELETIRFGLDGNDYEIDLPRSGASELRKSLRPYLERGRRMPHDARRA